MRRLLRPRSPRADGSARPVADPATDHLASSDDGVTGIVIEGNKTPVIHPPCHLASPDIDASQADGQLDATYYRWSKSDDLSSLKNVVEVYDRTKWVEVCSGGDAPRIQGSLPLGAGWTFASHESTAYKNPMLKVRIGHQIMTPTFQCGWWNVDDLKHQNTSCPSVP